MEDDQVIPVPIEVLNFILPTISLKYWSHIKLQPLTSLMQHNQTSTFENIQTNNQIPPQGLYTYRQIASYLQKHTTLDVKLPHKAWSFWTSKSPNTKGITILYNLLQSKTTFVKTAALKRWERDLQTFFSDSQWRKAILHNYTASKCVNYWELSQKIHHGWYLTPVQMCKFTKLDDDHCWRGCSHSGSLIHILWHCPHIYPFWKKIFSFISDITGILTKPSPSLAILSIGIESVPHNFRTLVMQIGHICRFHSIAYFLNWLCIYYF